MYRIIDVIYPICLSVYLQYLDTRVCFFQNQDLPPQIHDIYTKA